jgi:hypothetical protein
MENEQQPVEIKKNLWKKPWVWVVIILIALISFALMYNNRINEEKIIHEETSDNMLEVDTISEDNTETNGYVEEVETALEEPVEQIEALEPVENNEEPIACVPDCINRGCGDDGCGGNCGECHPTKSCIDYQCIIPVLDM